MSRLIGVRFALACILALLVVGFVFSTGYSQFGRPPIGQPGGLPPIPTPPGMPGGPQIPQPPAPGMPGAGFPNGGMPGAGFPNGGMPNNGGMPGRPGFGGQRVTVWSCSGCGFEVAEGPIKPSIANCPKCGARFGNTTGGMMMNMHERMQAMQDSMRPPINSLPPSNPPSTNRPPNTLPPTTYSPPRSPTTTNPPPRIPSQPVNLPAIPANSETNSANYSSPSSESSSGGLKTAVVVIGLLVGVVFVVGVTGLLIWISSNSPSQRPKKHRRPARDQDDDDDDGGQFGRNANRSSMKERW
jgi:hypothetical protein